MLLPFKKKELKKSTNDESCYILLKCKLCGTTFCEKIKPTQIMANYDYLPISPKFHLCEVANKLKTEDSQILKPFVDVIAISNCPIKASTIV